MKIRLGFVSNSSSSSFIVHKKGVLVGKRDLSEETLHRIRNHTQCAKELFPDFEWYDEPWTLFECENYIEGYTSMTNFDMEDYLRRLGVPAEFKRDNGDIWEKRLYNRGFVKVPNAPSEPDILISDLKGEALEKISERWSRDGWFYYMLSDLDKRKKYKLILGLTTHDEGFSINLIHTGDPNITLDIWENGGNELLFLLDVLHKGGSDLPLCIGMEHIAPIVERLLKG